MEIAGNTFPVGLHLRCISYEAATSCLLAVHIHLRHLCWHTTAVVLAPQNPFSPIFRIAGRSTTGQPKHTTAGNLDRPTGDRRPQGVLHLAKFLQLLVCFYGVVFRQLRSTYVIATALNS